MSVSTIGDTNHVTKKTVAIEVTWTVLLLHELPDILSVTVSLRESIINITDLLDTQSSHCKFNGNPEYFSQVSSISCLRPEDDSHINVFSPLINSADGTHRFPDGFGDLKSKTLAFGRTLAFHPCCHTSDTQTA